MAETGYAIGTLTELKAISAAIRSNGYTRLVVENVSWYVFLAASTTTADNINILQPDTGTGRWFRVKSFIVSSDVADLQEYIQDEIAALFTSSDLNTTYNDTLNTLVVDLKPENIVDGDISTSAEISQNKIAGLVSALNDKAAASHNHNAANIVDFVPVLLEAIAANYNTTTNNLSFSYNTTTGELDVSSTVKVTKDGSNLVNGHTLNFTGTPVTVTNSSGVVTIDIAEADPQATAIIDTTYSVSSNALAPGASQQITLTLPAMCMVRSVVSNFPARVRVYLTAAYATADASRLITADPIGDHGCLLEVSSNTNNWSVQCAPPVYIYRLPTETTVVVLIDNTSATTNTYTVNFNTYKW